MAEGERGTFAEGTLLIINWRQPNDHPDSGTMVWILVRDLGDIIYSGVYVAGEGTQSGGWAVGMGMLADSMIEAWCAQPEINVPERS